MPEELPSVETGPNTPSNDETSREEAQPTSSDVVDSNTAYIKGWPLLLVIMVLLSRPRCICSPAESLLSTVFHLLCFSRATLPQMSCKVLTGAVSLSPRICSTYTGMSRFSSRMIECLKANWLLDNMG